LKRTPRVSDQRSRSLGSNSPVDCCAREKKVLLSAPVTRRTSKRRSLFRWLCVGRNYDKNRISAKPRFKVLVIDNIPQQMKRTPRVSDQRSRSLGSKGRSPSAKSTDMFLALQENVVIIGLLRS